MFSRARGKILKYLDIFYLTKLLVYYGPNHVCTCELQWKINFLLENVNWANSCWKLIRWLADVIRPGERCLMWWLHNGQDNLSPVSPTTPTLLSRQSDWSMLARRAQGNNDLLINLSQGIRIQHRAETVNNLDLHIPVQCETLLLVWDYKRILQYSGHGGLYTTCQFNLVGMIMFDWISS